MQYDGRRCQLCGGLMDVHEEPGQTTHTECEDEESMS